MLVAQTAATAGPNQHSAARNAFVFVLKTDNFWFVPRQYSSAQEHIHSMFAACLLTVHTSEHHVLGCRIRLCRGICSIVCTGLQGALLWKYQAFITDTQIGPFYKSLNRYIYGAVMDTHIHTIGIKMPIECYRNTHQARRKEGTY